MYSVNQKFTRYLFSKKIDKNDKNFLVFKKILVKQKKVIEMQRFCCNNKENIFMKISILPPLTWHDRNSSWPSKNGPALSITSRPCASNIFGSLGWTEIK